MDPELIENYLDFIDKAIKISSAAVPVVALILRKLRLIDPKPDPHPLMVAAGAVGFGCLGSIIGLSMTIVFGVGAAIFIGLKWMDAYTGGELGLRSIEWGIWGELFSRTNLIFIGTSIVSTLLAFGGKEQPKGLAFIAGIFLGATFAIMFLLSTFIGSS